MTEADIEDTYLDTYGDMDVKFEPDNLKKFYRSQRFNEIISADSDDQQLYKLINYPANIIIPADEKASSVSDPSKSFDQVRLIQIANANYKGELGKYNASFQGQTSQSDPSDTLDIRALKRTLENS